MHYNGKNLLVMCLLILNTSMYGMEIEENVCISSEDVVLNLICNHYLGHDELCLFAATSKESEQRILASAPIRKNLLSKELAADRIGVTWHKYGSRCCYAYKRFGWYNLGMACHTLRDCQHIGTKYESFEDFISPLSYQPAPFLNEDGIFSFYGYGKIRQNVMHRLCTIVRYDLNGSSLRCVVTNKEGLESDMSLFLEYPVLLKAILNTTEVTKKLFSTGTIISGSRHHEEILELSLDGVVLPYNYGERTIIPGTSSAFSFESIQQFPWKLKSALEKRYKECSEQKTLK